MKIKTYVVDKLNDAYPMIFNDLGPDAFILNSKPVRARGLSGFFGKKRVEVVAAAEIPNRAGIVKEKTATAAGVERASAGQKHTTAEQSLTPDGQKSAGQKIAPEGPKPSSAEQRLMKELAEVKGLIHTIANGGQKQPEAIPAPLAKWVKRLEEQEVDEEVISYIVNKAKLSAERMGEDEIGGLLLDIITELYKDGISKEADKAPKLITLVGPTGAGKTTTIAKLAADRVFKQRQKVGLITADTFRIAAVEQLNTYATILNLPMEVVYKAEELKTAMDALKSCKIVFMDSAGRNYLENEYIEEINQYLRYDGSQENYLVLSMPSRWRDMKAIVEQMKSVPIDKLILTKWDETSCYGTSLNMVYHYPYPLAYLCMGQGVPQDIMKADAGYMAKKLLGVDDNAAGSGIPAQAII